MRPPPERVACRAAVIRGRFSHCLAGEGSRSRLPKHSSACSVPSGCFFARRTRWNPRIVLEPCPSVKTLGRRTLETPWACVYTIQTTVCSGFMNRSRKNVLPSNKSAFSARMGSPWETLGLTRCSLVVGPGIRRSNRLKKGPGLRPTQVIPGPSWALPTSGRDRQPNQFSVQDNLSLA